MTTTACNIDGRELTRRRRVGRILLVVGYALAFLTPLLPLALLVALPLATAGGIVVNQARRRTCIGYALAGLEGDDAGVRRVGLQRPALLAAGRVALEGSLAALPLLPFLAFVR